MSALESPDPVQQIWFTPKRNVLNHLIVNCILGLLAVLAVVGRMFCRRLLGAGMWWDDAFIVASLPLALVLIVAQGQYTTLGSGYSVEETAPNLPLLLHIIFPSTIVYLLSLTLINLSIQFVYLRVFQGPRLVLLTKISIGFTVVWGAAHLLAFLLLCSPIEAHWDIMKMTPDSCGSHVSLYKSIGITNIVTDVVIMLLPIRTVWTLQIKTADKMGIIACFGIGIIVIVAEIVRLVYIETVDVIANLTATMPLPIFLSTFEPNLAIVCFSMPMLRPLLVRCRQKPTLASGADGGSTLTVKTTGRGVSEVSAAA